MPEFVDEIAPPRRVLAVQVLPHFPVALLRQIGGRAEHASHQRATERAPRGGPLARAARGDEAGFLYRYGSHDLIPASSRRFSSLSTHSLTMNSGLAPL